MILPALGLLAVAMLLAWWRARRQHARAQITPLGGLDTGCRSPFRTPVRFFAPRKGF